MPVSQTLIGAFNIGCQGHSYSSLYNLWDFGQGFCAIWHTFIPRL